jgi:hypothetical protein
MSSDLPGVNPTTLNRILLYYRLMIKRSGLGDSTELSRVRLSQLLQLIASKIITRGIKHHKSTQVVIQ